MGSFQGWPIFIYFYSNGSCIPSKNKNKAKPLQRSNNYNQGHSLSAYSHFKNNGVGFLRIVHHSKDKALKH
jgi:hypothetical protein